jgi:hypothetical protein
MSPSSHWIPFTLTPGATDGGISIDCESPANPPPQLHQPQTPATYVNASLLTSQAFCVPIHPNPPRPPEFSSTPDPTAAAAIAAGQGQVSYGGNGRVRQRVSSNHQRSGSTAAPLLQQPQHHRHRSPQHHQPAKAVKHKRRYCGIPGCRSIVKSQGVCQRHGAKPRKCRVETCAKQAQGNFGGMCKVHYKASVRSGAAASAISEASASGQGPAGSSSGEDQDFRDVHQPLLVHNFSNGALHGEASTGLGECISDDARPSSSSASGRSSPPPIPSVYDSVLPASLAWRMNGPKRRGASEDGNHSDMPFVEFLKTNGSHLPGGWHRRQERHARGYPLTSASIPEWDDWERELIWTELLLVTGAAASSDDRPDATTDLLAHAWGCRPGFHAEFIAQWIGERRTGAPQVDRLVESHYDVYEGSEKEEATVSEGGDDLGDPDEIVDDGDDADCMDDGDDEHVGMTLSVGGSTPVIGADAWDDACYTAHSYNEALASDLLLEHLSSSSPQHAPDGILLMMDRHHEEEKGVEDEDDEDRLTDDASSSSSREDVHLAQVVNE